MKHRPRASRPYKSSRRSRNRRTRRKHGDNRSLIQRRNLERLWERQDQRLARRMLRPEDDPHE